MNRLDPYMHYACGFISSDADGSHKFESACTRICIMPAGLSQAVRFNRGGKERDDMADS